jgi:hypothetical protein
MSLSCLAQYRYDDFLPSGNAHVILCLLRLQLRIAMGILLGFEYDLDTSSGSSDTEDHRQQRLTAGLKIEF